MEFISRDFEDIQLDNKLKIINSKGAIGILTLWSKIENVVKKLKKLEVDLSSSSSDIAVIGNLYGPNGIKYLLANLLFNPQITSLIICGLELSNAYIVLNNYFTYGIEEVSSNDDIRYRVVNTNFYMHDKIEPSVFELSPKISKLGQLNSQESLDNLKQFFISYKIIDQTRKRRIKIDLKRINVDTMPSNPRAHTVVADSPIEVWEELIFRIVNFGIERNLKKGKRRILQNVKAIIEHPSTIDENILKNFGFAKKDFEDYQKQILNPSLIPDVEYSYGNRIGAYFGDDINGLELCIDKLLQEPLTRKAMICLWDMKKDLKPNATPPCLYSIYFQFIENKLTLTACFRTHNAYNAWLLNFYGLMAILDYVSNQSKLISGSITIFSQSISIAPEAMPNAVKIAKKKKQRVIMDPMGYFEISLDIENKQIIMNHKLEDVTLKTYKSAKAIILQHQIARDVAISDINHAIYIGRQLAAAEYCLKNNTPYTQQ